MRSESLAHIGDNDRDGAEVTVGEDEGEVTMRAGLMEEEEEEAGVAVAGGADSPP